METCAALPTAMSHLFPTVMVEKFCVSDDVTINYLPNAPGFVQYCWKHLIFLCWKNQCFWKRVFIFDN